MATIQDVAKRAGVSVSTVSRVMNNTAPVNQNTRDKIVRIIEELNYTPSLIAQGMRTRKSKTIAIIIPDYMNSFYYELLKHIEDLARKEGYHVVAASTNEDADDEISYINELFNRNIDGIIVCMYKGVMETIEYLMGLSKKVPVIFMDNFPDTKSINSVSIDGYSGIKDITNHLIELGHKDIAFIKHLDGYSVANERYQGYLDALKEAGIELRNEFVYGGNYHVQGGYNAAKYFLSLKETVPTAIVASNDLMAIGALNYIKSRGFRIPLDIAIAGFDDVYMSKIISPPLTTYRQPIEIIAHETINMLINKINHPTAKNRQVVLKGELVVRRSTDLSANEVENIL